MFNIYILSWFFKGIFGNFGRFSRFCSRIRIFGQAPMAKLLDLDMKSGYRLHVQRVVAYNPNISSRMDAQEDK